VKEQILSAVGRKLEAVVHDLGRREVPQINVAPEVRRDIQIEQAVAIVIDPDRAVAVHPTAQASFFGDVLEVVAVNVSEQRQITVAINQHVLAPVIVEVTPHCAHRHALTRLVEIGETRTGRDLFERAVAAIVIKSVGLAEATVGEVKIGLSVAIEVGDGHRCSQSRYVRLDASDLWIEGRPMVNEMNASRRGLVTQHESRVRSVRDGATRPAIKSHREEESGKKGYGEDSAPNCWAGAVQHESEYNVRPSRERQRSSGERIRGVDEWPSVGFAVGLSNALRLPLR